MEDGGVEKAGKEGEGGGKKDRKKVKFSQGEEVSEEGNARFVYNLGTESGIIVLK